MEDLSSDDELALIALLLDEEEAEIKKKKKRNRKCICAIGGCDSPKMVQRHHVQGYENFLKYVEDPKAVTATPTYVLYTGTKLPDTGESWCPDCVEAEPFIEKGFEAAPEETLLVIVEVGDRPFWKDHNCPFRTNPVTKLKVLPTLAKWGTQKRLEGDQLLKLELIDMLLTDEDD